MFKGHATLAVDESPADAEAAIKELQRSNCDLEKLSIPRHDFHPDEHAAGNGNTRERMKYGGKMGPSGAGCKGTDNFYRFVMLLVLALVLPIYPVQAANPSTPPTNLPDLPSAVPGAVLYSQISSGTKTLNVADSTSGIRQAADDFTVPAGGWLVGALDISTFQSLNSVAPDSYRVDFLVTVAVR